MVGSLTGGYSARAATERFPVRPTRQDVVRLLSDSDEPKDKRPWSTARLPVNNPRGTPFQDQSGAVLLLGGFEETALDPKTMTAADLVTFGDFTARPNLDDPVYREDGTTYFVGRFSDVYAYRNGTPVGRTPGLGRITTPLASSPGGDLLVGLENHQVQVLGSDLEVKATLSVPLEEGAVPERLAAGPDGSIYVLSSDGRICGMRPDGSGWSRSLPFGNPRIAPVVSADGLALYVSGVTDAFHALDVATGEDIWTYPWRPEDGDINLAPPVQDSQGNIHTCTRDGVAYRFSPRGEVELRVPTGARFRPGGAARCQVAVGPDGYLMVTPDQDHFLIYSPGGEGLAELRGRDLFDTSGSIQSFGLSRDGSEAFVLGDRNRVARLDLLTLEGRPPDPMAADSAGLHIVKHEESVDIGAITLPRRSN